MSALTWIVWGVAIAALLVLIVGLTPVVVPLLSWGAVRNWVKEHKGVSSSDVLMIKQELAAGRHRVIAGVLNGVKIPTAGQVWETDRLDGEVEGHFAGDKYGLMPISEFA